MVVEVLEALDLAVLELPARVLVVIVALVDSAQQTIMVVREVAEAVALATEAMAPPAQEIQAPEELEVQAPAAPEAPADPALGQEDPAPELEAPAAQAQSEEPTPRPP